MMTDKDYIYEAYLYAQKTSTDPSTQNGALLVKPDFGVVAMGANHFPFGVKETLERWERPLKYKYVEHAERNSIFDAARNGKKTAGLIMYCPWFACADCARAIIQVGIREVVGHNTPIHDTAPHWKESIAEAMTMFSEAGLTLRYVEGEIGVQIRFNGKVVTV